MRTLAERVRAAREEAKLSQAQLAKASGVKAGAIGNIEMGTRKQPRNLIEIAAVLGVRPEWLKTGRLPRYPEPRGEVRISQPAAQQTRETPVKLSWEALALTMLPSEFETELPDQAMAPDAPRGSRVIFVTGVVPEPGDWVLIRDRDGNHHMREYRQSIPGRWQAHAINAAFLPLDSEADAITVVAVFDGMRGRRAPR